MQEKILEYYSRKDVQKAILNSSKNREVAVKYQDGNFGKRPDILQFENDILELAKQGASSFHISEEHWGNPLLLKPGMTKSELDNLRIGWDCILDIDTKFLEYAKIAASLIIGALRFHGVKNIGCKFSGGSGFHIGVPFASFPPEVNAQETKLLFPEGVRVIASYIKNMIAPLLSEKILDISTLQEIANSINKKKSELLINNVFNPFSVLEIDSILISNRHMYRSPYSINEKKFLVSTPILPEEINSFKLKQAKIENVKVEIDFLPTKINPGESSQLIIQAFDSLKKQDISKIIKKQYQPLNFKISQDSFPPCIIHGLNGLKDGRKRFLFILINFLKSTGYPLDDIEKIIETWNKKNTQQLQQGYINSQLSWHKRQKEKILPPNCSNNSYYKDIAICRTDNWCKLIRNPVNYSIRKRRVLEQNKTKRKKS